MECRSRFSRRANSVRSGSGSLLCVPRLLLDYADTAFSKHSNGEKTPPSLSAETPSFSYGMNCTAFRRVVHDRYLFRPRRKQWHSIVRGRKGWDPWPQSSLNRKKAKNIE
ncbi:uncharacterized protein CLUP02_01832 [Colletotrichum lupini]|uniref:Uncharacterized protein n=1 Tax=Colletotrichum lupini TaxID=145971 RepID=A0A9Q8SDD4_9PEZI|nr:uncharacterized protein CLUP02_01832 [Colletotrichum lupini]UQC75179.1 hypothetical protein CLUP02_01832 [Colletotrichum lupini]